VSAEHVSNALKDGHVKALRGVPEASEETIQSVTAIVAQMGPEPVMAALENGADVIVCGRAYDPAIFAALPMLNGFDIGLALHMGKILECGSQCSIPGAASDCMLGTLSHDSFIIEPLNSMRSCTPTSVAAHTLYEKSDPGNLPGPGGVLDLSECRFEALDKRRVKVSGSRFLADEVYRVKLEGAALDGYRSVSIAGVRDPIMIEHLDECLEHAQNVVRDWSGVEGQVNFLVYGRDAVMGMAEPMRDNPSHEVGLVMEAIAEDQETADHLCSLVRSTLLHYHYTDRKATAGNLAFAFAPSDMPAGPVYRFVLYHTIPVENALSMFKINWVEGSYVKAVA
jgi:hypothetical protein